jgi:hypothetical protein
MQRFGLKNVSGTDPNFSQGPASMSNPATSDRAVRPFDPNLGLRFILADQLIPLFQTGPTDVPLARLMALGALEAYNPESRADYVNSARTIAFSIASLALLGHAAADVVPMTEKMRAYGRANALNRSADQSERTMMQRRRYQNAHAPAEQPHAINPNPEPRPSEPTESSRIESDAQVEAAVAEALAVHRAHRPPAEPETTLKETTPGAAKTATPRPEVSPIQPPLAPSAIHTSGPRPDLGQPRATSLRAELLRHSAMPHPAGQSGAHSYPL